MSGFRAVSVRRRGFRTLRVKCGTPCILAGVRYWGAGGAYTETGCATWLPNGWRWGRVPGILRTGKGDASEGLRWYFGTAGQAVWLFMLLNPSPGVELISGALASAVWLWTKILRSNEQPAAHWYGDMGNR